MKLYAGYRKRPVAKTFVGAVVEIGHRRLQVVRKRCGVDGIAMIVRGDQHFTGYQVHHGLISAAMSVGQLEGARAACERKELMAKADAKERLAADERPQNLDRWG